MKAENRNLVTRGIETEPDAGSGEIPIIFFGLLAGMIFLSLLYLDKYGGGFNSQVYRPYESYNKLFADQPLDPMGKAIANGRTWYETACKPCHQTDGLGTPGQFPPLDGSEWVNGPVHRLVHIPQFGLNGPIQVKGQQWNAVMLPVGAGLTDQDLADLLTYVRQAWSNKSGPVKVEEVAKVRKDNASRTANMTAEELLKIQ
jgi:mono/diheme cytochrome c family protein